MKRTVLPLVLILSILSGCAFVNVTLTPAAKQLEEELIEGEGRPKLLLLDLDGMISFKEKSEGLLRTKPSAVAFFREALRKAEGDAAVAGVIVRINSPGGSVAASDTIYHDLVRFREKRKVPVYAYIMEVGASGGYYVAAAADRIIASPASVTGSIGVLAMKLNADGLFSKIGVVSETYTSGPKKDFWSPFRPSSPEEQKMLQGIIDGLFARFIAVVHASRQKQLSEQEIRALADGRIMTAGQARAAGLIDETAYLDETIEAMKKALKIEQARVVMYTRPGDFASTIYSGMPVPGPQVINLVSINAEELLSSAGVRFLYLWNP